MSDSSQNRDERFLCEFCNHSSSSHNNLLRHYRENSSHKPGYVLLNTQGRPKETASDVVSDFLPQALAPRTRSARIKAFLSQLTAEEVKKYCLPLVSKEVSPSDFLLECAKTKRGTQTRHVQSCFNDLREALVFKFPELTSAIYPVNLDNLDQDKNEVNIEQFVIENKQLVCQVISDLENENIFKQYLMPIIYKKHEDQFIKFACGLVGALCVSQRDTQDVLRNTWGKQLSDVLGINIFPPKDIIVKQLNATKEELSKQVELQLAEQHGGIVVASIDVKKYLEYLLDRSGMDYAVPRPNGNLLIYHYTDLAPWLKWSRFSTGITTLRLKVVEPHNLQSLVITCGAYLGSDDYDTVSQCFSDVYEQISNLDKVKISEGEVTVNIRCVSDGKQRRNDTGNGSAKSSYPICDAPEHVSQLGNMSIISHKPVWSVEDTKGLAKEYKTWLGFKVDNIQNRRDYAKCHLGNMGRENITKVNLEDYYVGTLHLALRSAESIATRIGQCAAGNEPLNTFIVLTGFSDIQMGYKTYLENITEFHMLLDNYYSTVLVYGNFTSVIHHQNSNV